MASLEKAGIKVEAVPMYNLTPTRLRFLTRRGNDCIDDVRRQTGLRERGHGGHS